MISITAQVTGPVFQHAPLVHEINYRVYGPENVDDF
jgi:hypothetical protein